MIAVGRRQHSSMVVGVLALALIAGASCTGKSDGPPSLNPGSATPTPSVNPSVADAEQQARAAYAGYITAWALASQVADPDSPDLARYIADPLLSLTRHNIRTLRDKGAVQLGAQTSTVVSTNVDLAGAQPKVTINACLDYSALRLVYRANQSPVPGSEIKTPRVSSVATVSKYATGQWLVNDSKQGGSSC